MEAITHYIHAHSDGKQCPICGSQIANAFGVSDVAVRHMINEARCNGDPICSGRRGYYIASSQDEIQKTIDSLEGRIAVMRNAKEGLERCMFHR